MTIAQSTTSLSPTERTQIRRVRERAATDREALYDVLTAGLICHLGVVIDGAPRVLPTAFAFDPDGPDRDGTLYLHGSVAAASLVAGRQQTICVTVTVVDGLVLARSAFHHSMNYRSAVVIGDPRLVTSAEERDHALTLIVDRLLPGRAATLRDHTRKELAATTVLGLPLHEASVKIRAEGVGDEPSDIEAGSWAGVVPVRTVFEPPETDPDSPAGTPTPPHVDAAVRSRS
ncbi:MAG TPA: pyridoxamine 5'-phosphate oxidase family protein [Nocardioidaceae bacterium]|nr:pyridoxamine 5'-phosphate oxidase family protein [Nocardioidaceae bacterium]